MGRSLALSVGKRRPGLIPSVKCGDRMEHTRQAEFVQSSKVSATALAGAEVVDKAPCGSVHKQALAKRLIPVISGISRGTLAVAAQSTKEAAKSWKSGDRVPDSPFLLNLARHIFAVHQFVTEEIEPDDPSKKLLAIYAALQRLAATGGPEAAVALSLLRRLNGEMSGTN